MRVPVEKKLKQSVVFNIDHLKVQDDWAFMLGAPRKPGGGRLDYRKTAYAEAQAAGMFHDNISALLHKVRGRWRGCAIVLARRTSFISIGTNNIARLQEFSRTEMFCSRFALSAGKMPALHTPNGSTVRIRVRTASDSDRIKTQIEWLIPSLPLRVLTRPLA